MPWILRELDRAGMANGVESRAPFLDWRLMAYAFALPVESNICVGSAKYILREGLTGSLPEAVRTRRKKLGIPIDIYRWLAGLLKDYAPDTIASEAFLHSPIWDGPRGARHGRAGLARGKYARRQDRLAVHIRGPPVAALRRLAARR